MEEFVFGGVQNILEKGENACKQYFLHFPQCFLKASFLGSLKTRIVGQNVDDLTKRNKSSICIRNQSVENAGVAFVKGAYERNESFERINKH